MFEFKTNNNTINLKWGTWAMMEFTRVNNITIDEFFRVLSSAHTKLDVIVQLVYIGYKSANVITKQDLEYTEFDACDWIDNSGGIFNPDGQVAEYLKYVAEATVHAVQGVTKDEKKKPKKVNLG